MIRAKVAVVLLTICSVILILVGVLTVILLNSRTEASEQHTEALACVLVVLSDTRVDVYDELDIELGDKMEEVCHEVARARRGNVIGP